MSSRAASRAPRRRSRPPAAGAACSDGGVGIAYLLLFSARTTLTCTWQPLLQMGAYSGCQSHVNAITSTLGKAEGHGDGLGGFVHRHRRPCAAA